MPDPYEYLGAGIILPFRRDGKQDFANSSGLDMVRSSVRMILETMCSGPENEGELRFNQRMGTQIQTLRHRNIDDPVTQELATHYVYEALKDNEPRALLFDVRVDRDPSNNKMILKISYRVTGESDATGESTILTEEVTI